MTVLDFQSLDRATPVGTNRRQADRPAQRAGGDKGQTANGRRGVYVVLLVAVGALVLLGTVMGLSSTAAPSLARSNSAWTMFKSQGLWLAAGIVVLLVLMQIDYRHWRKLAFSGLCLALLLLVLTTFSRWGISNSGAQRWLAFGPISFQPSEVAKLPFVMYVADLLSRPRRPVSDPRATVHPVLLLSAGIVTLQMMQPHLGASMLIVGIAMTMLYFGGASLPRLAAVSVAAVGFTALMIRLTPWRMARLSAFFDPWSDPMDSSYQVLRSLHALASGGIMGVGLGEGRSKWGFLPDAHTDFIFAVIGEELGMVGALAVVLVFLVFAVAGLCVGLRAPDRFGMLLAIGITTWIVLQAALNIGAVIGIFPVVGITLPLLSIGGSSVVSTLAAVGVLLNVARQSR